ncbi:MAG: polysaccharide biosynthesis protein [Chitinophagaceae bacterium]|nr:MAG: polysaccharide biosynthesis protein [Chitinophagaceae bacterium]
MSTLKKLSGQTLWYGVSSIAARFLNYLLFPYLTSILPPDFYGDMSLVYALIPFLNILFTYGLETAYFRFVQQKGREQTVYDTITVSLIISTISFTCLMILFRDQFADLISIKNHPEYITWSAFIIALDALTTISFARLRQEGRPVKYALVRVFGILINIGVTIFFLSVCPALVKKNPASFVATFYDPTMGVGYIIIANLVQSGFTFLMLSKEFFSFRWKPDFALWKQIMLYSLPLLVAGFGGMINETFDRIMLGWWSTAPNYKTEIAIYSGCYKLAILISLFVQAFRLGAEPFFFKQAQGEDAPRIYARVMKFFVITICFMFLVVALYLDSWKLLIRREIYWEGLKVVPILLFANMFLGIYYNLSIWYKITGKTKIGASITFIGAAITLAINAAFIPAFGYMACAWATFFCYGTMMVISFTRGQKAYYVPYAWKKLIAYMVIVALLYFIHAAFESIGLNVWFNRGFATLLLMVFGWFILNVERKEFIKLPVIGRMLNKTA